MAFPNWFRPKATRDLIRVGSPGDGGYVLPKRMLDATKGLLSMGLCDDWTFEADVHKRTGAPVVVFDHSVDARFWVRRFAGSTWHGLKGLNLARLRRAWRFIDYRSFFDGQSKRHVRRAIGRAEHGFVNLEDAIKIANMTDNIMLKIDIEGSEYRIFDQIVENRSKFCGIAMELHDIDIHEDRIRSFLNAMEPDFALVHFHANNCTTWGPEDVSIVVEISMINRALLDPAETLEERSLPIAGLDAPNLPNAPDIVIRFEDA